MRKSARRREPHEFFNSLLIIFSGLAGAGPGYERSATKPELI